MMLFGAPLPQAALPFVLLTMYCHNSALPMKDLQISRNPTISSRTVESCLALWNKLLEVQGLTAECL